MENSCELNDLIYKMRISKGLTQQQIGKILCVSDKTVSNWETHRTTVAADAIFKLQKALDIDINAFPKEFSVFIQSHNKIFFYVCPICKSVTFGRKNQTVVCCGKKIKPLTPAEGDYEHHLHLEYRHNLGCNEITSNHEMTDLHHIKFVAYVSSGSVTVIDIIPEGPLAITVPRMPNGSSIYFYCNKHGLFKNIV